MDDAFETLAFIWPEAFAARPRVPQKPKQYQSDVVAQELAIVKPIIERESPPAFGRELNG
jgi:hypothetical protein